MYWITSALFRATGAVGIAFGLVVLVTGAGMTGGRFGGLNLVLLGGLVLYVGARLREADSRRRQLRAVRHQLHFLDQVQPDRNFWPDGI